MSCGDGGDMISRWGWQFAERWGWSRCEYAGGGRYTEDGAEGAVPGKQKLHFQLAMNSFFFVGLRETVGNVYIHMELSGENNMVRFHDVGLRGPSHTVGAKKPLP